MEFIVFRQGRAWRWVLNDRAGQPLAVCAEAYSDEAACKAAVAGVKSAFRAPVEVIDEPAAPGKREAELRMVKAATPAG